MLGAEGPAAVVDAGPPGLDVLEPAGNLVELPVLDEPVQGWQPEKALPFAVAASRMAIAHQRTINPGISAEKVLALMEQDKIAVKEL